jgi:hypothetical protein
MANSDEAKPNDGVPAEPSLPIVASPKLDGSEETVEGDKQTSDSFHTSDASGPPSRSFRFAMLAASLAVAAALGSMVGALSASRLANVGSAALASSNSAEANKLQAMKAELAELSALKANLDGATRSANGQFAKIADRLDRVERAAIEPAVKLAHIADAVDRLEKKTVTAAATPAAPETTGSIAKSQPPAPAETKVSDKVLQDWIVQDVRGGHVLVASRYGGVFEVAAGVVLPGVGRVETIKRQDGQWVVVTEHGLITAR